MLNDTLARVLSIIHNGEKNGERECTVRPVSIIIKKVLTIMKDELYIGEFTSITESRGGVIKINLLGNINKCGVIKPRYSINKKGFEKFEKRYLPAKDFGLIIVSTSKGIMTHMEAKEKGIGGRLLAYCY